jgi:hypothetical protein
MFKFLESRKWKFFILDVKSFFKRIFYFLEEIEIISFIQKKIIGNIKNFIIRFLG